LSVLHQPLKRFSALKFDLEHRASGATDIDRAPALMFAVTRCRHSLKRLGNALAAIEFSAQQTGLIRRRPEG